MPKRLARLRWIEANAGICILFLMNKPRVFNWNSQYLRDRHGSPLLDTKKKYPTTKRDGLIDMGLPSPHGHEVVPWRLSAALVFRRGRFGIHLGRLRACSAARGPGWCWCHPGGPLVSGTKNRQLCYWFEVENGWNFKILWVNSWQTQRHFDLFSSVQSHQEVIVEVQVE